VFAIRLVSEATEGTLVLVVGPAGPLIPAQGEVYDEARELCRTAEDPGRAGAVQTFARPLRTPAKVLLIGAGEADEAGWRQAGAAAARSVAGDERLRILLPDDAAPAAVRGLAEGLWLAGYRFRDAPKGPRSAEVELITPTPHRYADPLASATATAESVWFARDLTNMPSSVKNPEWFAQQVIAAAATRPGLTVTVRDEVRLAAEGFGGILAVGAGSARPPRLIELSYRPARASRRAPHVVLVGKGITFDSGGLSLKPRESMVPMKTDMAAGGAVIAVMAALRDLGVRARVTGLVAAAENLPGASAYRPGDVITHYGGRTVEVVNTDAEGRLVLADALAYADARLAPDILIDMATLTGAASQGLGRRHAALYTADEALAGELAAAGEASGDRVWRMPLVEDYRASLDSEVADLSHISRDRSISGGSITAALFLREFVGARRWVHLDIAGPARADRDEHEVSKGATGFGARLLLRWLETLR
jgi:leucyl aminopeptidase